MNHWSRFKLHIFYQNASIPRCYALAPRLAYLDEPDDVVGVDVVLADPGGQDVPLDALATVDGDAQLGVLVLGRLQVQEHLLRQLRQEAPVDDVVLKEEGLGFRVGV